jgi:predicted DNA binding CopG/RHH family protein
MKKLIKSHKVVYTDEPMNIGERVYDLSLPSPKAVAELINKQNKSKKVTINLDQGAIAFFRKQAHLHNTKYQTMIKTLLNEYVHKAQEASSAP